jgi:small nuclear ribonucleoprotein (snRNP)-like protein
MHIVNNFRKARIVFQDNKLIEGVIVKCDFHMNTIVKHSVEYRLNKKSKKWEKRDVGLCVIRGCSISTISLI